jgi:hypothetical protein
MWSSQATNTLGIYQVDLPRALRTSTLALFKTKMHFKNTLLTAALSASAAADFIVITEYPRALQTLSPEQVRYIMVV